MGIWGSWRRGSSKQNNPRSAKGTAAESRRRKPLKARGLRLEQFEDRMLLSISSGSLETPALEALKTPATSYPNALDNYVAQPDAHYHYTLANTIHGSGTAYIYDLVSQGWLTSSQVSDPSYPAEPTEWHHWLQIVVPNNVDTSVRTALLVISGGGNGNTTVPSDVDSLAWQLALQTGTVVVNLPMIPNGPLNVADYSGTLEGDPLIAYSFDKFLDLVDSSPETASSWPAYLPMVNSVVRAMDTVQEVVPQLTDGEITIDDFVLTGASKRGWTTQLATAVDPQGRVKAMIPIVAEVSNLAEQMAFQRQLYQCVTTNMVDGYSSAVDDYVDWNSAAPNNYTDYNVLDRLATPEGQQLLQIVDPFAYKDRATMAVPKYYVNSTGDQFFSPGSSQFYIDEMNGPTYLRYVPNTDHGVDSNSDALQSIINFYSAEVAGDTLPTYDWSFQDDGHTLLVDSVTAPTQVLFWQASNPNVADFRYSYSAEHPQWTSTVLVDQGGASYVAHLTTPQHGAVAGMIEMDYLVDGKLLKFTTSVSILTAEVSPEVVAVLPSAGNAIKDNDVLHVAPRELVLKFNEDQKLNRNTLGAIQLYRVGSNAPIPLGYIDLGDNANEVVLRFTEALPSGSYELRIDGSGTNALRNSDGVYFHGGQDLTWHFSLDLAPTVSAVVPQPITRDDTGALSQARAVVEVYFQNSALDQFSAETPDYYQLIFTQGTADNHDDVVITPVSASYDVTANKVTLTFSDDLANLGTGAARLRVGDSYATVQTSYIDTLYDGNGFVLTDAGSTFDTAGALGDLSASAAAQSQILTGQIQAEPGEYYYLEYPGATDDPGERDLPDFLEQNDHIGLDSYQADTNPAITTVYYNFAEIIGHNNAGLPVYNLITEAQKDRAREIFALYSQHLGVQFVETDQTYLADFLDIQVARGDLVVMGATSAPGGISGVAGPSSVAYQEWMALADSADDWGSSEFGGAFTTTMMGVIGYCLGYGYTDNLTTGTLMPASGAQSTTEQLFPGSYDVVHGQYMYRPDNVDIDLYQFAVTTAGTFSAEINAERMAQSSLLDSVLTLYKVDEQDPSHYTKVASNDDYYSNDSFLQLRLEPGTYYIGVSAKGNSDYDPNLPNSGIGGTTEGAYDLRLNFVPGGVNAADPNTYVSSGTELASATGIVLDGDADGVPGSTYNFWFNVQSQVRPADGQPGTIYVDKLANASTADGSLEHPYKTIPAALAVAQSGDIVRIVGNNFANDDVTNASTYLDNKPYKIGLDVKGVPMEDGATLEVPQGVTLMVDAGALFKMRLANVDVGSSSEGVDRSSGALQVLGIPGTPVYFTSNYDDAMGGSTDEGGVRTARAGDWGGLVFRNDLDYDFIRGYEPDSGAPARQVLETEGIFLNYVNHADIRYAGGSVNVDGLKSVYAPVYLAEARPTITNSYIHDSADSAISADPNSFAETSFQSWDPAAPYTADYGRVGPDIRGNRVVDNSINGLFVRVRTDACESLLELETTARFDDWDIVHVLSEVLTIHGTPGGPLEVNGQREARLDASLTIDPGVIVKSDGARIEVEVGAQLIAEGSPGTAEGSPGYPVIFTSLFDTRYGAGGTFATDRNTSGKLAAPGDWGGLYFEPSSEGSLDRAVIAFAGGTTTIEGNFASFDPVEIRQAQVRITNSRFEDNTGGGVGGDRGGRGVVTPATIYVRGAQPVLIDNLFIIHTPFTGSDANIPVISIDANSMTAAVIPDWGRATGQLSANDEYRDNYGPLVRGNRLTNNGINGMEIRGETLSTESIWDDTDIVHVLRSEIIVTDYEHGAGVLRLQSSPTASLVVKLAGTTAGFTAKGTPLETDDRIGGTLQVVGSPQYPVILTALADDTVGAGLTQQGLPQTDTNNDGSASAPAAGAWRSLKLDTYCNDRNVVIVNEAEATSGVAEDLNATPTQSQYLGLMASSEVNGDDQQRLGFDVHGTIRYDAPNDADVYAFNATAGTEIWLDIDRTRYALDAVLEVIDSTGRVLARSDSSMLEEQNLGDRITGALDAQHAISVAAKVMDQDAWLRSNLPTTSGDVTGYDYGSTNVNDPGMRLILPGTAGTVRTYYVRVSSASHDHNDPLLGQYQSQTAGEYELQVRLREQQEVAGSTVRSADIRYASTAIEVLGQPGHSPLLVDTAEIETNSQTQVNDTLATAQSVGNYLATDQASLSWRGYLTNSSDVDWYKMSANLQNVNSVGKVFATIFDVDYADGLGRADLSLWVFDSTGKLILSGNDSNIADDQPEPLSGASIEDLSRGSAGTLDPFIGSVYLPEQQTYYVAVTSSLAVPTVLDPLANPLTRVEPIDSITRIVEEHVETTLPDDHGNSSPYYPAPVPSDLRLTLTPTAFGLGDVTTYVVAGREMYTVNASNGSVVLDCTGSADLGQVYNEISMRNDGQLYAVATNADASLAYRQVDTHNATNSLSDAALGLISYAVDPTVPNDLLPVATGGVAAAQAMTCGPDNDYRNVYVVSNSGGPAGAAYVSNLLWILDSTGKPLGPAGGDAMPLAHLTPSDGGSITGITFVGQQMYAVSSLGSFYRVDGLTDGNPETMTWGFGKDAANDGYLAPVAGGPHLTLVATLGSSFAFSGLTTGPADLYPNLVFATTASGRIYALNLAGGLQPVFNNGATYADTHIAGLSGIAFSPIDYNLWHVTRTRSNDAGHGINGTVDDSRTNQGLSNYDDYGKLGYESWHFGLEDPRLVGQTYNGPVTAQPGLDNFYDNSTAGDAVFNTYDAPGGAHGTLVSSAFDLSEYKKQDKPVLYFNYYADTEGATAYDGLKVYVSSNGGNWTLAATNIDWNLYPSQFAAAGYQNAYLQKLYDTNDAATNSWRQARVDLGSWAGSGAVRLRFEFDTRSTQNSSADGLLAGAQNNAFEGIYIDDIIVGFAERGEMVTAAPTGTDFAFTPLSALWGQTIVTTGSYQVNVRRGADYGYYTGPPEYAVRFTDLEGFGKYDTNARLDEGITLSVGKSGSQLTHGDTFRLTDGVNTATFVLWDLTKPGTPSKGQIPVYFYSSGGFGYNTSTKADVAGSLASAINNQTKVDIRATAVGTHVDLFGATRFEEPQQQEITQQVWGTDDPNDYDLGDSNIVSQRGQIVLEANTIGYSSGFGIAVAPGARDQSDANLPHPGSGATLATDNKLVGGVTIVNNLIIFNVGGGIHISGDSDPTGQAVGAVPYARVINNTISGGKEGGGGTTIPGTPNFPNGAVTLTGKTTDANKLRDTLLGSGITPIGDASFVGSADSAGYWTDGTLSGIILTCGDAEYAAGPNTGDGDSGYASGSGDPDLDAQLAGQTANKTTDTCYLKFDFQSTGGDLYFNYVFASEEYNEYSNSPYNDVFAFFLDGTNVALIPGTTTPVSINNVNGGKPLGTNPQNAQYYNNNDPSDKGQFLTWVGYDGFTDVLSVQVKGLSAGTHTIKLAVADVGDQILDSAVFIQGGTFSDKPTGIVAAGKGIVVDNNASPTILNNIVANVTTGISVDSTSVSAVLGANIYQGNDKDVAGTSLGTFDLHLAAEEPLFVDALKGNFNLAPGSKAIDSAIQSLQERGAYYNSVLEPLGIDPSPLLAPDYDFYGHLREDDPSVSSDPGQGANIFKDRGAIERVDFDGPQATLVLPMDNGSVDRDTDPDSVVAVGQLFTEFDIQLSDPNGVGVDDASVISSNIDIYRDSVLLVLGVDYFFHYDPATDLLRLVPSAGIWAEGYEYKIILNNQKIEDLAKNLLQPNHAEDGTTYFTVSLAGFDFGDAPDNANAPVSYQTRLANDGARHVVFHNVHLGAHVNGEPDAKQSAQATGDQYDDGVTFASDVLIAGQVEVTVDASVAGYLNAWIDFNGDGVFNSQDIYDIDGNLVSPSEKIFDGELLQAGLNTLTINVPAGLTAQTTFARFRFTSEASGVQYLESTGEAPDGEVEDYLVRTVEFLEDFGDAPETLNGAATHYATTLENDGARHAISSNLYLGSTAPDGDRNGHPSNLANGDESTGIAGANEEDGVSFYAHNGVFSRGREVTIDVTASEDSGFLNAWIDFNGDGDWNDAGEQIAIGQPMSAGVNQVTFNVPTDAKLGMTYARFRLSTQQDLGASGWAPDGEVEDYALEVIATPYDFGDAPVSYPSTTAQNGARHVYTPGFQLGANVDYESDAHFSVDATGDNSSNVDDEDGVTYLDGSLFGTQNLIAGQKNTIVVNASADGGFLNAWLDLNGDGDWADDGEQIFTNQPLYAGNNELEIALPRELNTVKTFARFRFSTQQDLSFTGAARDGEVEDYAVKILAGEAKISGYAFNDINADRSWDTSVEGVEPGMGGVTMYLYNKSDYDNYDPNDPNALPPTPVADAITSIDDPTTSNVNEAGYYQIAKLFAGDYVLVQDMTSLPTGFQQTRPYDGLTLPNGATGQSDGSYRVTLAQKSNFGHLDFGDYKTAGVGVSDVTVLEGNNGAHDVQLTLHLTESFGAPVTVYYDTSDGSAKGVSSTGLFDQSGNSDYLSVNNGSFTFTPQVAPLGVWATKKITSNTSNDYDYDVSGQYVVWENYGGIVSLYDNATGKIRQLTVGGAYDSTPAICGTHVVWTSRPVGEQDTEILLYDIPSDTIRRLTTDGVDDIQPAISEKYVVWASGGNIELYDLAQGGSPVTISHNAYVNEAPQISGSRVVWTAVDGNDREIFLYDGLVGQTFQLSNNSLEDRNPIISDKAVVWERFDGTDYELMAHRFSDGATFQVTSNSWNDEQADLSGSQLVWRGSDGSDPEILYVDLASGGTPVNISNDTLIDEQPQILGNRVVWHAYVGNNWDVFYKDLSSSVPATNVSAIPGSTQYDWYAKLSDSMVVWRAYVNGNYEIIVGTQSKPEVTAQLSLTINGDTFVEHDEYFHVNLTGADLAVLVDPDGQQQDSLQATVSVLNDDGVLDYGDAPEVLNGVPTHYATTLVNNGARHVIGAGYYLGSSVDAESDGRPTATANGDDTYISDDEDGIVFGSLVGGTMSSVTVTANLPLEASGKLSAWIDFNGDGDWSDDGEQILTDEILTASATSTKVTKALSFYVPADVTAKTSFARFRFDRDGGLASTGTALTGEVEDYSVTLKKNPYLVGSAVSIVGGTANDSFRFAAEEAFAPIAGGSYHITYNNVNYYYPTALVNKILFYGQTGVDTTVLQMGSETDNVWIWPNQTHLLAPGLEIWAYTSEKITVTSGGGDDLVRMYDSSATDAFTSTPTVAKMLPTSGTAYANEADGFRYVYGFSSAGGDTANLYDSAGNDTFSADPVNATLSGDSFFSRVNLFRYVNAYGSTGNDTAGLKGSSGVDTCTAAPTVTTLVGSTTAYSIRATGFDLLRADGGVGADVATLTDSAGNDTFSASPTVAQLFGTGFNNILQNFETATATSSAGLDTAVLLDSTGNDTFTASLTTASMKGTTYSLTANKFAKVTGRSTGGTDTATLNDSAGNDYFIAYPTYATMAVPGSTSVLRAENFRTVIGVSATGTDSAFFYDGAGDDTFTGTPTEAILTGTTYKYDAKKFANVYAYGTGGKNTANLTDSTGNDTFAGKPTLSTLTGTGYQMKLNNFQAVNVTATSGTDLAYFYDSLGNEVFQADGATTQAAAQARMTGASFGYLAKGFDKYYAYATTGGFDQAILNGTTGNETFTGSLTTARLYNGSLFDFNVSGFDEVTAYGKGGTDSATLTDGTGTSTLEASGSWAKLSQSDLYFLMIDGFKNVTANSTKAGNTKSVQTIDYLLSMTGDWT